MEINSMLRTVVRYFSNGKLRREVRPAAPRVEALEAREVMTVGVLATASILTPPDGSALSSGTTSIVVQYSEDVLAGDDASNYLLLDSSGKEIPLGAPTYDGGAFTATFNPAQINNGAPLPLDTYTLFVRQDQILDADDGVPLAGPNTLIVSSGPRRTVSPVQVSEDGTLGAISNYPVARVGSTNPNPTEVGGGDFNRDGIADLAVVNNGTGTVNIHLGRTAAQGGGFAVTPDLTLLLPITAAGGNRSIVVGNFDDDNGDLVVDGNDLPDIAVMNTVDNSVSFFRNTGGASGSLSFAPAASLTGLNSPVQLRSADLDGDGFDDLVAANGGAATVTVFLNNQAGGFAAGVNLPVTGANALTSLAVADFDGDLSPDIAVAGNNLTILFNDSTPGSLDFIEGASPVSTTNFLRLVALRVDANATNDLVGVTPAGAFVTLLNLTTAGVTGSDGTFVEEAAYVPVVGANGRAIAADLDGDGIDEVVVTGGAASNEVSVLASSTHSPVLGTVRTGYGAVVSASTGTTVLTITSPGHGLTNGDSVTISGVPGNVNANGTFTVSGVTADTFLITASSLTPSTGAGFWARTGAVTDASNDIDGPIVITAVNHRLTSGTRVTIAGVAGNIAANGTFVINVLDADSFELVGSAPTDDYTGGGTWTVTGSLGVQTTALTPAGPTGVAALDVNGDGAPDVVTANRTADSFTVLAGAGDRTFLTPAPIDQTYNNTGAVAYADLNGDGIKDVVSVSNNPSTASSQVSVMLGLGDGTFEPPFDYPAVSAGTFFSLSSVSLIDVDGDSDLDIVVTGTGTPGNDGIAVLTNDITTPTLQADSFLSGTAYRTGDAPTQVVGGDFNGDGILDLAVAHNGTGGTATSEKRGVTLLAGIGGGAFAPKVEVSDARGFAATGLVALDYDKDGDLDLAVVSGTTPANVLLLRNRGTAGLGAVGVFDAGLSNAVAVAAADVNLDGFTDLVVASGSTGLSTGGVSVLLNEGGTGFKPAIRSDVLPGTALAGLAVSDLNQDGKADVVVSALPGAGGSTADNVFQLAGNADGTFNPATPYHAGAIDAAGVPLAPSHVAVGDSPLLRLTTFQTGGTAAQNNLVANGGFEAKDLNGQAGTLTGWTADKVNNGSAAGSAGGWGVQSGPSSPLSGESVIRPSGTYQAMLDQPDVTPFAAGQPNPNSPGSYSGSHVLYQDIVIPANATTLDLSLRLYIRSEAAFSNPAVTPSLNYITLNANQQVRVDVITTTADLYTVSAADILLPVFQTFNGDEQTQVVHLDGFSLAGLGLGGQTVRLRIASVNNRGKLIVGVDDVRLVGAYEDTTAPTLSNLKLRTPGTNTGTTPQTTDPTITGRVTDNGGLSNLAYVEFDPTNGGFRPGTTFRTSTFDPSGNFSFTFPGLPFGVHTVAVRAVDRAGNATTSTITFEYMGLYTNDFQQAGPTGIKLSDPSLGYSAVTGRITSVVTDPSDRTGNTYYVGSANGGVWKTTDGGSSWTPLMNNVMSGGQRVIGSIGGLAVSRSSPNVLYAGLGVADLQHDSRAGSGILKSTNGGQTWTLLRNSNTTFANARISKVVVDPTTPNLVYVAVASGGQFGPGVYKTTNGGSTWANILSPAVMGLAGGGTVTAGTQLASVTDLVIDPFNRNRLLIGLGNVGLTPAASTTAGVWLTTNAVAAAPSWRQVVGGVGAAPNNTLPSGVGVGTVKIGIGNGKAGDESTVYVLIGTPPGNNTPPNVNLGGFDGLYKTSDNLLNFTRVSLRQDTNPTVAQNFQDITLGSETTYAASLAVDPSNPNVVFVGGSRKLDPTNPLAHALIRVDTSNMNGATSATNDGNDATKSAAGGDEGVYWYDIEQQASNSSGLARLLPPTVTALWFDAQGRLLIGTDGGLWSGKSLGFGYDFSSGGSGVIRSAPGPIAGMRLTAINGNLQITSVTSAATDPTSLGRVYATTLTSGGAAADGPLGFVSQDLSRGAGGTFNAGLIRAATPAPGAAPDAPTTLYRIWQYDANGDLLPEYSTDNGETWTAVPNFLAGGDTAAYFPAFALNPTKVQQGGQYFDEALFGTNRVYQTRTSGFAWESKSQTALTTGRITALGIAPSSTSGFYYAGTDQGELFVNPTGGSNDSDWLLRTTGLPTGLAVTGIAVFQTNPNAAYVSFGGTGGTAPRLYFTNNGGVTWRNVSLNLPRGVSINSLVLDNRPALGSPSGKLYVATDAGVFVRALNASRFTRIGTLPAGPVVDLSIDTTKNILSAAVLGRGAFNLGIGAVSPIADQVRPEDVSTGPLKFTLNTLGVGATARVTASSDNQAVVANSGIRLGGTGSNRTITVNPVANASGTATITLRVTAGRQVFLSSFTVTFEPVNDVPTVSAIAPQVLPVNSIPVTLPFAIDDLESGAAGTTLTVTATSDNQALIPDGNIIVDGTGPNRTIQFQPEVNAAGTARITISVTDPDGGVGTATFDVLIAEDAVLPFADDFNRGNNTFLGSVWTDNVGNTDVVTDGAQTTANVSVATLNGVFASDVALGAAINLPARSNQFASVVARYQGTGDRNMYYAGVRALTTGRFIAYIYRNVNGRNTLLASKEVGGGTGTIRLEAVGNSLKLFFNNQMVAFAYDRTFTDGAVGLRGLTAGTRFDDFSAEAIDLSLFNPGTSFTDDFNTSTDGQLSRNWVERAGNVRVEGGVAVNNASVTTALLNPLFVSFADATVTATVTTSRTGQFAGLIARSNEEGTSFYMAGLLRSTSGPRAVIYRVVNGQATVLASAAVGVTSALLSFEVTGSNLTLSVDGNPVVSVTDFTLTQGTFGIRGSGAGALTWDDFTMNAI